MSLTVIPQFLRLSQRPCLLLGDNDEAITKGQMLLEAGADLRVIAQHPENWPAKLTPLITWIPEPFSPKHLTGVWLVVSALGDVDSNQKLFAECQKRQIFLNVVDQPDYCSFIWPAVVKRPPFLVAISTGGQGPALAGWLKRKLENELPDNLGELAPWFADWRKITANSFSSLQERGNFWRRLFNSGLLEIYLAGDKKQADRVIKQELEEQK